MRRYRHCVETCTGLRRGLCENDLFTFSSYYGISFPDILAIRTQYSSLCDDQPCLFGHISRSTATAGPPPCCTHSNSGMSCILDKANLHWLPVYSRTDFKLATLCFKSHVMRQPDYLAVTLDLYEHSRSLRSSTQHFLSVPFCNTVLGKHRFSVAAPLI